MRVAILSLSLLIAVGAVRAGEAKIDPKDLPPSVLAAVKARFPEGNLTGATKEKEDNKVVYEVALTDHDAKIDVAVSAKGKILEVEKTIDPGKLPTAVAATIKSKYPKAKIKKAEEVVKYEEDDDDKPQAIFEVVLATSGKGDVEVKVSPTGKILEEEDEDDQGKKAQAEGDEDDKPKQKENGKG